jgi:hypothetical protein
MAVLPDATITVRDGALGLVEGPTSRILALVGVCSLGTAEEVATYTDASELQEDLGTGPLVEAAVHVLTVAKQPVVVVPVNASVVGVASAVTADKTGTGDMTVDGDPLDAYSVIVELLVLAANLAARTATFRYSLDGGVTYSSDIAMPLSGVYEIPGTGLTLTFTNGASGTSFEVGDAYSFTCTAPGFAADDLSDALDALLADQTREWFGVHVVGAYSSASLAAGMYAAVKTKLATAASNYRFVWGIIEVPDGTATTIVDAFASTNSTTVTAAAGVAKMTSAISGREYTRSSAWAIAARAASVPPKEDLAQVKTGPLPFVKQSTLSDAALNALNSAGFATLRQHKGLAGVYVAEGRIKAPTGSDFQFVQYRRIMDIGSLALRRAMLQLLNADLDVDELTGFLTEAQANALRNEAIARYIQPALRGQIAALELTIPTAVNLVAGEMLTPTLRLTPFGYAKQIAASISFKNPALEQAAQG